jgi:hypothetical protein
MVALLQPGDHLLYAPNSLVGWLIAIKCASWVCHIEVYLGDCLAGGSRDGIGVDTYPMRFHELAYILRPIEPLDFAAAFAWHESVRGEDYEYAALLNFYLIPVKDSSHAMVCSEYVTLFDRAGGLEPFASDFSATKVHPAHFLASPVFSKIPLPW